MPQDRTLDILCTFTGAYSATGPSGPGLYGQMAYTQVASQPPMPGSVVASDGTIDIGAWTDYDHSAFNPTVDITFSLIGSCTLEDGRTVPVAWSPEMSQNPNGQPAMLLLESDHQTPAPPNEVEAMWAPGSNQTQILVDDRDETKDYYFRPAVVVPAANDYYISCDPPIVNRGRNG